MSTQQLPRTGGKEVHETSTPATMPNPDASGIEVFSEGDANPDEFWCVAPDAPLAMISSHQMVWPDKIKGQRFKRFCDVAIACGLLAVVLPASILICIAIRIQDGGPALFGHRRIGLHGREFKCWKFRTMIPDAEAKLKVLLETDAAAAKEWEETRKLRADPRVTKLGHFLRKSSLDELPQLWNVIRGEMSLVGPRPIVREELERYGLNSIFYFMVRPGVTGAWQVNGRSNASYEERVKLDKDYTLRRSFWKDALLIVQTGGCVLFGRGAV
ncbi:MAG: sugar transferase [Pseudomonadota bacterium]